jgi:hypothetical protein
VNIIVRIWTLLRSGHDPQFSCTEQKIARIEADLQQANGLTRRKL